MEVEVEVGVQRSEGAEPGGETDAGDGAEAGTGDDDSGAPGPDDPAAGLPRPGRSPWIRAAGALFVAVVAVFVVQVAARHAGELSRLDLRWKPVWTLAAAPFTAVASVVLPLAWWALVRAYRGPLGAGAAVRVWWLAQVSRYVPTGLAAVAARIVLAGRLGVRRSVGGLTQVLELGCLVASTALVGAVLVPSSLLAGWMRGLLAAGAAAVLAAVALGLPWASRHTARLPGSLGRRLAGVPTPHRVPLAGAVGLYGVNAVLRGASFVFLAAAVVVVEPADAPLLAGAWNLAAWAGLIGITPAGLGVREAALAALLTPRFGLADAAALAVVSRAWEFAFELVWVAGAAALARRAGRRTGDPAGVNRSSPAPTPRPPRPRSTAARRGGPG